MIVSPSNRPCFLNGNIYKCKYLLHLLSALHQTRRSPERQAEEARKQKQKEDWHQQKPRRGDVGVGSRSGSDYYVVSCRGHNTGTKWVIYIPCRRRHTTRAAASTVRGTDASSQSREHESTWDQNHPSSLPISDHTSIPGMSCWC